MDDRTLLQQYAATRSDAAFATLVDRHVDMVYAACLWRLRDPAAADDATQATFVALAARAGSLSDRVVVAGWLYRTAVYQAAHTGRATAIRRRHEMAAAQGRSERAATGPVSDADAGEAVGRALDRLRPPDRAAVVLRYLEGRSLAEVATEMRTSEEAARKRVSRGLDRLRHLLLPSAGARPGAVGTTAAVLRVLTAGVGPAPAGVRAATLKAVAAHAAHAAGGSAAGLGLGGNFSTLKGSVIAMAKVKMGTSVAVGVAAALVAGGGVVTVRSLRGRSDQVVHVDPSTATAAGDRGRLGGSPLAIGGPGQRSMLGRAKEPPLDGMIGPADAPWRPGFDQAYRLNPGEVLRQVPGPPVPEREPFNAELASRHLAGYLVTDREPAGGAAAGRPPGGGILTGGVRATSAESLAGARASMAAQNSIVPPPDSRCLYIADQDGRPAKIRLSSAGDFQDTGLIKCLSNGSLALDTDSLPPSMAMPGDWVVRGDASPKAVRDGIAAVLSKRLGREVRLDPRPVPRTTDSALGTFHYTPLPGFPDDGVVRLDDRTPADVAGRSAGPVEEMSFVEFRSRVGPSPGPSMSGETAFTQRIRWAGFKAGMKVDDKLRALVNRQTGLDWQVRTDTVTRFTLVDADGRAVPPEAWAGK